MSTSFPKIGIRPAIDGRRKGVRESLEAQTMGMAKRTADFLSANLHYPDGSPVQCVIADTCIGGVAEAAQAAEKFKRNGVGVSITVTPCWCYGSETMDMDPHLPKAVWGLMARSVRERYTWQRCLLVITKKDCQLSQFMVMTFKNQRILPCPWMSRKSCCVSPERVWRWL